MNSRVKITASHATVKLSGRVVIDGFSGSFESGMVTAMIGGDGAGKSTLLKVLTGRVDLADGSISGLILDRNRIGYRPSESGVWGNLSVAENIEFVSRVYHLPRDESRERAERLLRRAGLSDVTHRLAGRLSGGMRQKLGVVLATLHQPDLVLLDEPTTGVDPISRAELWELIASIAADDAAVVFSTTYLDEAERANNLFLLDQGRVLAEGTPDEVIDHCPGKLWQAPAELGSAQRALQSDRAWRRGNTVYVWSNDTASNAPVGFATAPNDLENTSIALMLEAGGDASDKFPSTRVEGPQDRPRETTNALPVKVESVSRKYGSFTALKDVSLTVESGEIVGLLGGNGAGKTTLMRLILGLESPTTGRATLFGNHPSLESRRHIGYVAQGLGLYPDLSPIENLEFAASAHGVRIRADLREYAASFGKSPTGDLPLGTRRILAYLAASVHQPNLLILDEPTSGMDALARARLWKDLRNCANLGVSILITTHYMQEAAQCDRLTMLSAGQVAASGTVDDITAGHSSVVITTGNWQAAFKTLTDAGIPCLLDGRILRSPGSKIDHITHVLSPVNDDVTLSEQPATLEETMMLTSARPAVRNG